VQTASTTIVESQDYLEFLNLEVKTNVATKGLELRVLLQEVPSAAEMVTVMSALLPSSFNLSTYSSSIALGTGVLTSIKLTSSLSRLTVGSYRLSVQLHSDSSTLPDHSFVYVNGNTSASAVTLQVVASTAPLAAPELVSAAFSSDGASMQVLFSAETDRGGTSSQFLCSQLFSFACANSSVCTWSDESTVTVSATGSSSLCTRTGQPITLTSAAKVRAKCRASSCSSTTTQSWPTASTSTRAVIAAPIVPLIPSVVVSAYDAVGSCAPIVLDVGTSAGSGGRSWKMWSVTVSGRDSSGSTVDASALQAFVSSSNFTLIPPTRIPASYLRPGESYVFQVTLCNFLGSCSSSSRRISVLTNMSPSLTIPGAALLSIKRKDALSVAAQGWWPRCEGVAFPPLSYTWSIKNAITNASQSGVPTLSRDPARLLLNSFALQTGGLYKVSVSATATGTAGGSYSTAMASVQVLVETGDIKVMVGGSTRRTVRLGELLSIDASGSYDEDFPIGAGPQLRFSWSCMQSFPSISSHCRALFVENIFAASQSTDNVRLRALDVATNADAVATLSVVVQDMQQRRSASSSVQVVVLPSLAPSLQILPSVDVSAKLNPLQSFYLSGKVDLPVGVSSGSVAWLVDESSGARLASSAMAATNLSLSPSSSSASRSLTFYLPLNLHSLPLGVPVAFSLSCIIDVAQSGRYASSTSISLTVNSPPRSGSFVVAPDSGVELSSFTFACTSWVDDDLPLTYQFGFVSVSGASIVMRSRLSSSFTDLQLAAGPQEAHYVISALAQVFDALASNVSITFPVTVQPAPASSTVDVTAFVRGSFNSSATTQSVDSLKQAAALSSYLLNQVNCSLAPRNCSALNRKACFRTPHTCGPCLSDQFAGDAGDSNEACVRLSEVRGGEGGTSGGVPKACALNCSGHGVCRYRSVLTGQPVDRCVAGELGCQAVCQCAEVYSGSTTCAVSTSELTTKQALREEVLSGLTRLTTLEDPDSQSLDALSTSIVAAAQNPDELSSAAQTAVLNLTSYIFRQMNSSGEVNSAVAASLLDAVQSVLTSSSKASGSRRRLVEGGETPSDGAMVTAAQDVLGQYVDAVSQAMTPGQQAVESVHDSFRVHTSRLSAGDLSAVHNTSIVLPRRPSEEALGMQRSVISVPLSGDSAAAVKGLRVSAISTDGHLLGSFWNNSLPQSDVLAVKLSAFPCASVDCRMLITVSRQQFYSTALAQQQVDMSAVPEVINITCLAGSFSTHSYRCAADGRSGVATCRGRAETVQVTCAIISHTPVCAGIMGLAPTGNSCEVVGSTADNITCACPVGTSSRESGRRLSAANASLPDGEVSISYVALMQSVSEGFEATVLSVTKLNAGDVGSSYKVLVTIGVFASAVVAALLFSQRADEAAGKVESELLVKRKAAGAVNKQKSWLPSVDGIMSKSTKQKRKQKKKKADTVEQKGQLQQLARGYKGLMPKDNQDRNGFMAIAEEALPAVLQSKSLGSVIAAEMKQHHRWLGVVYHYSDQFPRVLRVASLATNIIVMLFIQSLTYNFTNGDDGSCERLETESSCLEPSSVFATGESKCYWLSAEQVAGGGGGGLEAGCHYVQPSDSMKVMLFVAIFSALISCPIALFADYLITRVLGAKTKAPKESQRAAVSPESSLVGGHKLLSVAPSPRSNLSGSAGVAVNGDDVAETAVDESAQKLFAQLARGLRRYLHGLEREEDRREFQGKSMSRCNSGGAMYSCGLFATVHSAVGSGQCRQLRGPPRSQVSVADLAAEIWRTRQERISGADGAGRHQGGSRQLPARRGVLAGATTQPHRQAEEQAPAVLVPERPSPRHIWADSGVQGRARPQPGERCVPHGQGAVVAIPGCAGRGHVVLHLPVRRVAGQPPAERMGAVVRAVAGGGDLVDQLVHGAADARGGARAGHAGCAGDQAQVGGQPVEIPSADRLWGSGGLQCRVGGGDRVQRRGVSLRVAPIGAVADGGAEDRQDHRAVLDGVAAAVVPARGGRVQGVQPQVHGVDEVGVAGDPLLREQPADRSADHSRYGHAGRVDGGDGIHHVGARAAVCNLPGSGHRAHVVRRRHRAFRHPVAQKDQR